MTDRRAFDRHALSIVLAVGLTIVIIGLALLAVATAGGSDDAEPERSMPTAISGAEAVPPGDYDAVCAELVSQGVTRSNSESLESFRELYAGLDFEALIAVAPADLKPDLEANARVRDEVVAILRATDDVTTLDASTLPKEFIDSGQVLVAAVAQECDVPE